MTLRACCGHGNARKSVRALAALGLPTEANNQQYHYPCLSDCTIPKLFLSGDHDEFAPVAQLEHIAATAAEPKRLLFLSSADHFFTGLLQPMQQALAGWLKEQLL